MLFLLPYLGALRIIWTLLGTIVDGITTYGMGFWMVLMTQGLDMIRSLWTPRTYRIFQVVAFAGCFLFVFVFCTARIWFLWGLVISTREYHCSFHNADCKDVSERLRHSPEMKALCDPHDIGCNTDPLTNAFNAFYSEWTENVMTLSGGLLGVVNKVGTVCMMSVVSMVFYWIMKYGCSENDLVNKVKDKREKKRMGMVSDEIKRRVVKGEGLSS